MVGKNDINSEGSSTDVSYVQWDFFWYEQLKRHIVTHNSSKNYKCKNCDKKFIYPSDLTRHVVTIKTKQHKCCLCPQEFCQFGSLKEHIMDHNGIKNYPCSDCDKKFT